MNRRRGQATIEFAVLYASVILPLTFMTIFASQAVWIWHGVVEFTRDGARYAATHCVTTDVVAYMQSHVPPIIDQFQFQSGQAIISVEYLTVNTDGTTTPYSADGCSGLCVPDSVSVSVSGYTFGRLAGFLKLPGIVMPSFTTNLPIENAGYQDATGSCAGE